jgi:hypothetical protein
MRAFVMLLALVAGCAEDGSDCELTCESTCSATTAEATWSLGCLGHGGPTRTESCDVTPDGRTCEGTIEWEDGLIQSYSLAWSASACEITVEVEGVGTCSDGR